MKLFCITSLSLLVSSSLAINCLHPRYTPVNNQCLEITCQRDTQCTKFKGGCVGKGHTMCRPRYGICGCSSEKVTDILDYRANCNQGYKCLAGEVCTRTGNCIKNPLCHTQKEYCSAKDKCCPGLFCHKKLYLTKKRCYRTAEPGEACGVGEGNGIPCIKGSVCQENTKTCSKVTK